MVETRFLLHFCLSISIKWEKEEDLVADDPSCSSWQLWTVPALSGRVVPCEKGMTAAITWHLAVLGPVIARMGHYLKSCRPDVSLAEFLYQVLF